MSMALDLGKPIGPLPLGAWIAVVGGGLAIGFYVSRGTAKNAAQTTPPIDPDSGVGTGGGQLVYDPPTNVETPTNAITTNDQWAIQAINWLISSQAMNPGIAQTAITKFVTGQNRNLTEQGMINLALLHFGAPPEAVPVPESPIPTPPVVTNPKPSTPRSWNFYTVVKGDTPGSITRKTGAGSWWYIYTANDRVGLRPDGTPGLLANPFAIKPGMVLIIPTKESGMRTPIPKSRTGLPPRYYTAVKGDTLTTIATKYKIHPWALYTANDVVGPRPDGSKGILINFSVRPGQRLVVPY